MQEVTVQLFDDLAFKERGERIVAEQSVTLGYRGKWVSLDLGAENAAELDKLISPYMGAGRHLAEGSDAPALPRRGRAATPERAAYLHGLRKFANEQGISYKLEGSSGYYYTKALRDLYDAHLAELAKAGAK